MFVGNYCMMMICEVLSWDFQSLCMYGSMDFIFLVVDGRIEIFVLVQGNILSREYKKYD